MNRRAESGNATALALMATLLISGIVLGLAQVSVQVNDAGAAVNESVSAAYVAEAGLELVRVAVMTSEYDLGAGNLWLDENAIAYDETRSVFPGEGDVPALEDVVIGDDPPGFTVDIWIYAMDDVQRKYRVVARGEAHGTTVTLAQDLRARDTFARFTTFVDQGVLRFGTTTVAGDVHSNERIEFHYGNAKFLDRVTAVSGFGFHNGASEGNTSFRDQNRFSKKIDLPSITDVNQFSQFASGPYNVRGANPAYGGTDKALNARIEFLGDQVKISALDPDTGALVAEGVHPLPDDGVIYVQGDVTSIKGAVRGRVTVSTPGSVNITDNLLYVDAQGDSAMRLELNGEAVDPASLPAGTAWKEADGFKYVKNPDFDDAGGRPALGLLAGQEITLDGAGPDNLEVHAALFSATSNWRADLNVSKNNLRILGSITTKTPGARAQGSMGYAGSGEYIYDGSFLDNPPPHWLPVDSAFWGPRWRM